MSISKVSISSWTTRQRPAVLERTHFLVESQTKIFLGTEDQLVWVNFDWMLNSQQAPGPGLKSCISPFCIASCSPLFIILRCPQFTCRYIKKALIFWAEPQLGKATGTINYTSANCLKLSSSLWFDTLPSGPFLALELIHKIFFFNFLPSAAFSVLPPLYSSAALGQQS